MEILIYKCNDCGMVPSNQDAVHRYGAYCNRCGGKHSIESPHRDLDTIDLDHDLGLRDLTDPWGGE